jgi:hypothetical protein
MKFAEHYSHMMNESIFKAPTEDEIEERPRQKFFAMMARPDFDVNEMVVLEWDGDKPLVQETPLMMAVKQGYADIVEKLLKYPDIDPNLGNRVDTPPLMEAGYFGDEEIVKLLLSHPKIDVNAENLLGTRILKYTEYGRNVIPTAEGRARYDRIINMLEKHGAR